VADTEAETLRFLVDQFGGMKADDAKRLKELERENQRLKRIVADQALNIDALEEVAKGNW